MRKYGNGELTPFDFVQMNIGGRVEGTNDGGWVDRLWDMDMEVVMVVEDVRAHVVTQRGHGGVVMVMMPMTRMTHVPHGVECGVTVTLRLARGQGKLSQKL